MNIISYDGYNSDKLGIFFYDEKIYFQSSKNEGIRSYQFKVKIADSLNDNLEDLYASIEDLTFIHTCDIKNYIEIEIYKPGSIFHQIFDEIPNEDYHHEVFDWEKLILEVVPDEYKFIIDRIGRKKSDTIPEPTPYLEKGPEFLWLDDQSSFHGNFKLDDKEGCLIEFGKPEKNRENIFDFSPNKNWDWFDLSISDRNQINENNIYKWTIDQKIHFFESLSLKSKTYVAQKAC